MREGLDLPEVSLVAILDADKEGFLRSERSLTQTAGRAARNINGLVIMYADKITKSMNLTIQETNRRRTKQITYNKKHDLVPTPLNKKKDNALAKSVNPYSIKEGINIYTVRNQTDGDFKKGVHRGEDMYEMNGFIVHYFSENKVKKLLDGFINLIIENFNEGNFPRKLFLVINKKK